MERIVYMDGRGALVSDPDAFLKVFGQKGKGKGLMSVPLALAYGVELYEFRATFKGLEADQWAWMWLKGQHSARQAGAYVPTPELRKESSITSQACRKAFKGEIARKNALRKKGVKMIAVQGSWFLDEEAPLKGLGAYR